MTAALTLTPVPVPSGAVLNVSGSGFASGLVVRVTSGTTNSGGYLYRTSSTGTFYDGLLVNAANGATITIRAFDSAKGTLLAQASVKVGVTPPVPPPTSPMPHDLQADINATAAGGTIDLGGAWIAVPGLLSLSKLLHFKNGHITMPVPSTGGKPWGPSVSPEQSGSFECVAGAAGSTFDDVWLEGGRYAVLRLWTGANGITLTDTIVTGGLRLGIIGWQVDALTILRGRVALNNQLGGGEGYEAGNIKLGAASHVTITGPEIDHCAGPGIWADVGCSNWHVSAVKAHDCTYAGLMDEISVGPNLWQGNAVWECGWGDSRNAFNGGILLSSTQGAVAQENTIAWCPEGIAAISQTSEGRGGSGPNPSSKGTGATGNLIAVSAGHQAVQTYAEPGADTSWGPWGPNPAATAAQLAAAGVPSAPQPGH